MKDRRRVGRVADFAIAEGNGVLLWSAPVGLEASPRSSAFSSIILRIASFAFLMQLFLFAATSLFAAVPGASGEQTVLHIDSGPHLFVDDLLVAERSGLIRRVHPCEKLPRPVLEAEKPWEEQRVYIYGSVFPSPQNSGFLMWYMSREGDNPDMSKRDSRLQVGGPDLLLYATSKDGVHWRRPDVQVYDYEGSRANNIVFAMHSPSVLYDADEPDPAYRYKVLGFRRPVPGKQERGCYAAHSADGILWKLYPKNPVIDGGDTVTLSRNPKTGEYLAFFKRRAEVRGYARRVVYVAWSKDMQNWSEASLPVVPDEEDDKWVQNPPQRTEFYTMSAFPRGEQLIGLITVFNLEVVQDSKPGRSPNDGPLEVQLAHSRDGKEWSRCKDRSPIIPRGPQAYDAGSILGVSNIPVINGDQMWLYYTAMTTTHGGSLPEKRMSIGRAAWRLDGMVSLDAGCEEAVLETVPLELEGRRLEVNADASRGQMTVELLDRDGNALPGYGAEDCRRICSDGVRQEICWAKRPLLPENQPLRIRFRLKNTSLYAFYLH